MAIRNTPDHSGDDKERVVKGRISLIFVSILMGAGAFLGVPSDAAAQSDVTIDQAVKSTSSVMRLKGSPQYAVLRFDMARRSIIVEKTFDSSTSYDDFIATFPDSDCRYYLVDFPYTDAVGRELSRFMLITWTPENALVKDRMLYVTSSYSLRNELTGISLYVAAEEKDDVSYQSVLSIVVEP